MVAASTLRNDGGPIKTTRQRAAFSGRYAAKFSRIVAATAAASAHGVPAGNRIVHGRSRQKTAANKQSGAQRRAVFQRR